MNNRMNFCFLMLNNEMKFNIVDTMYKKTHLYKVGITNRFVAYYNKSISEFSDYLFLNIDFSEEFLNEYLIKYDENIIIEHEKLSKIRIDVRNIIL